MLIYALVNAKDEDGAVREARRLFDQISEDNWPFDYCTMFDGPGSEVSGKVRWGDLPAAVLADSEQGKCWIGWAMDGTQQECVEYIGKLRKLLKQNSDEDLLEEREELDGFHGVFRHYCRQLGQVRGTHIWLYAFNREDAAEGILTHQDLERALNGSFDQDLPEDKTKQKSDLKVWVVPADVHH